MTLTLGVLASTRKPDEWRLPLHPDHLAGIDADVRAAILLEEGYGSRFGARDTELRDLVGGVVSRAELIGRSDVVVLPKPYAEDLRELRAGQVLWGWPHCVQDAELTQAAIDRRLTLIAWEAMNHWGHDGSFDLHVFHANNELAGYASVSHALQLVGRTGTYGRPLRAAVISFGATGRGAVRALEALGVRDVTVLTQRESTMVAAPFHTVTMATFARDEDAPGQAMTEDGRPLAEELATRDVIVNCMLQDTERPLTFVPEPGALPPGTLVVDVSIDPGMGFGWSRATSFAQPLVTVGDRVHYYAVDHSPSLLWDSATWEISEALLGHLPTVMAGPEAWAADSTIARAVEIRDGVVVNPRILSFQDRAADYPHPRASA